jgi:GNAT superfamily N-acetyltransferase
MIGFQSLEVSLENCQKLRFDADEVKKSYYFAGNAHNYDVCAIGEELYKELYMLVCESIPGSFVDNKESYLAFLSDLTFKQRRGLARCKGIIAEGKLISSVITSAETQNCALLSAVASDKNFRGKGIGKATVLSIVNELVRENKKVFVIALNESAEGFYKHLGFEFNCKIATIRG